MNGDIRILKKVASTKLERNVDAIDLSIGDPGGSNTLEISEYSVASRVTSMNLGSLTSNKVRLMWLGTLWALPIALHTLGGAIWKYETVVPKETLHKSCRWCLLATGGVESGYNATAR